MKRYPNISKKLIKRRTTFSVARLEDKTGRYFIECFIRQQSKENFMVVEQDVVI